MEPNYQALCLSIHEQACAEGKESYRDPATGFAVFTRLYLLKRPCCKSACRHCPYGFTKELLNNAP